MENDVQMPWLQDLPEDETETETETKPKPQLNKHKGRFNEINAFAWSVMRDLSRSEIAVWLSLWTHTNAKTDSVQMSQSRLAQEAGCTVLQVKRSVKSLQKKKLLLVKSKGNNRTHEPSVYRVSLPV